MQTSILLVDDEPAFLDSVIRLLRIEGYQDVKQGDVIEAFEIEQVAATL